MTKVLIPRSDSISAKIIEPTDFTKLHSSDLIQNYVISGFTISAGSGLACNVAAGSGRLNGLYISSDATEAKSSLTASQTNSIYIKLDLDSGSEPEGWSLFSNTSGGAVTNAILLGTAVTNGSAVTGVTNVPNTQAYNLSTTNTEFIPFDLLGDQSLQNIGSGTTGDILYSNGTNWTKIAKGSDGQYLKLVSGVPAWTTLEDQIGTVTHQHGSPGGVTSNSWAKLGSTLTVATRTNGKYLCILNLRTSQNGNAQNSASYEIRVNGTLVSGEEWDGPHRLDNQSHPVTVAGVLNGDTIEVWGYHPWSSNNNHGGVIGGNYDIWEWSET